jgi:hypothetical protein
MNNTTGRCQCGAIRYAFDGPPAWVMHCHCECCRRATSAVVATYLGVKMARFHWLEGTPVRYSSSPGVERLFCGRCGSPIAYIGARWPDEIHLFHGTLEDGSLWPPTGHAYVKEQLAWFEVHDSLPRFGETAEKGATPIRTGPKR